MRKLPDNRFSARVDALDWTDIRRQLDEQGFALTPPLLTAPECRALADLFDTGRFRSTIDMGRHRFGEGRYRYFARPLPPAVTALRVSLYRHLAPVANAWARLLGGAAQEFPARHSEFVARCHAAGQERPTPLLLRYGAGDWNALHQDLYGAVAFPFQVLSVLSAPEVDFEGGELVLHEQRPRAQSRAYVIRPARGALVVFPNRYRPQPGKRGHYRVQLRHGVSTVTRGARTTLGIIFHDAS